MTVIIVTVKVDKIGGTKMNCKKCDEILVEEAKFCGTCGTATEEVKAEVKENTTLEEDVTTKETEVVESQESAPEEKAQGFNMSDIISDEQKEAAKLAAKEASEVAKEVAKEATEMAKDVTEIVKKMPPKKLAIIGGAAVAAVIAFVVLLMVVFGQKTLNLTEYLNAEFTGYEEAGRVTVSIDEYLLMEDIYGNMKNGGVESSYLVFEALDAISIDYDIPEEVENGDKIKVEVSVNENRVKNLGVKLKGGSITFKVEGLEEVEEIDPFEYITVEFTGTSPNVSATVKYDTESNSRMSAIRGQLTKTTGIAIGEELVLTLSNVDEEETKKNGYILLETEKTFTCEEADKYVEKVEDINEKYTDKFIEIATDELEAYFVSNDLAYEGVKYEGMYVLCSKEYNWRMNYIHVVMSASISSDSKDIPSTKLYFPMTMEGVILTSEGEYIYENSASLPPRESGVQMGWSTVVGYADIDYMYQKIITANKNDYNWDATEILISN